MLKESFEPTNKVWNLNAKGEYYRNEEKCNAEIVYIGKNYDSTFYVIKKSKAPWDKDSKGTSLSVSYSVGWEIENEKFFLGLPNEQTDKTYVKGIM